MNYKITLSSKHNDNITFIDVKCNNLIQSTSDTIIIDDSSEVTFVNKEITHIQKYDKRVSRM